MEVLAILGVLGALAFVWSYYKYYKPEPDIDVSDMFEPLPFVDPAIEPTPPPPVIPILALYYECQPFVVTQGWGVKDKVYERFGFTHHNGIDVKHGYNSRIRAPFDYEVLGTIWQPEGGGNVLSIVSKKAYRYKEESAHVRIDYLHLAKYLKVQGDGRAGELICVAGNTGFSTAPHTHIQHRWVRKVKGKWTPIEKNNANDSFDPTQFYNGDYAVNLA
jgi:murein DD-endopeptidase MepM/ murein hydrolase activator NlpD